MKPQSKMMAECGFKKDLAIASAGTLAGECNAKFGDTFDPNLCAKAVEGFIATPIGINCSSCGWRKPKSKRCTQRSCDTSDTDTCELYRHLHAINV